MTKSTVMKRYRIVPLAGAVLMHEGQRYELVGSEPYTQKDGELISILSWRSHCVDCGEPFIMKSGLTVSADKRRCPKHSSPGKPVVKSSKRYARRRWRRG